MENHFLFFCIRDLKQLSPYPDEAFLDLGSIRLDPLLL